MTPVLLTRRNARAFTMIEMIASIAVVLALAAIAVVAFNGFAARAAAVSATQNLRTLSASVLAEASVNGLKSIDRADVIDAMTGAGATVEEGLRAATWQLGLAYDSPTGDGQYAVGFAAGASRPQDAGGDRAAIVVHGGNELFGHVLDLRTGTATSAVQVAKGTTPAALLGNAGSVARPAAPAVTVDDATGAWIARWSAAPGATGYIVQAKVGSGQWATVPSSSRAASGPAGWVPIGATLQVRLRSTIAGTLASDWSDAGSDVRSAATPAAPTIVLDDATGAWSGTWPAAEAATGYTLQTRVGDGAWTAIPPAGLSTHRGPGHVPHGATVQLQVRSTLAGANTSAWSAPATATRAGAAPEAPLVTVDDHTGAFTATWPAATGAVWYEAQVRIGTNPWTIATVTERTVSAAPGAVDPGVIVQVRARSRVPDAKPSGWSTNGADTRAPSR